MTETNPTSFHIGPEPAARLVIFHACPPGDVKGFHEFEVALDVPGMRAAFRFDTRLYDFKTFRDEIQIMSNTLSGEVTFDSLEGDVQIAASIDKLGHIKWQGRLRWPVVIGNTLAFTIADDQSSLPNLIAAIDAFIVQSKKHGWGI